MIIEWLRQLFGWTANDMKKPDYEIGLSFTGLMNTWDQAELEVISISKFPDEEYVDNYEPVARVEHNPMGAGFPLCTARFRYPDLMNNDLLIYSESSRSYVTIERRELPNETAELVDKLRAGFSYDEATRGH